MKEIYVISNKTTGAVKTIGPVDREWDIEFEDDSTVSKKILRILGKDPDLKVSYLPYQEMPDKKTVKEVLGELVPLSALELEDIEVNKPKSEFELLKDRVSALELAAK